MQWLQQIFEKVLSLIPEIILITPIEMAARITCGKHYKIIGPGWYVAWPILQSIIAMEVITQVVDLPAQVARTNDGFEVIVSGALRYRINDVEKALFKVQDVDKALSTLALGVILEYVQAHSLAECNHIEGVKVELRKRLTEAARGWGVRIEQVYLTDIGKVKGFRLFGDGERFLGNK
jgi:regulator of protease activity HflC (stomatin/prohibitin superfamily)